MPKRHRCYTGQGCPAEATLELIRGKWKGALLFHLLTGSKRFAELQRLLPALSHRILTKALRELERDGLIVRTVTSGLPRRVDYAVSAHGASLAPVIDALHRWGSAYVASKELQTAA